MFCEAGLPLNGLLRTQTASLHTTEHHFSLSYILMNKCLIWTTNHSIDWILSSCVDYILNIINYIHENQSKISNFLLIFKQFSKLLIQLNAFCFKWKTFRYSKSDSLLINWITNYLKLISLHVISNAQTEAGLNLIVCLKWKKYDILKKYWMNSNKIYSCSFPFGTVNHSDITQLSNGCETQMNFDLILKISEKSSLFLKRS